MKYTIAEPQSIYELGQRANQEDSIYPQDGQASKNDRIFIVCDGMGGHEAGEIASNIVCTTMSNFIESSTQGGDEFNKELFEGAINATYDMLDEHDNGAKKKMGTTMTFIKFYKEGCFMAHIGDSRIYHIRPSKNEILYKSRDHSLINDLYDIGEITLEQMKTSSQKNVITRAMQPLQKYRSRADIKITSNIEAGDYFLLCTDGMLESIEDQHIVNILNMEISNCEKKEIFRRVTSDNRDNRSAYFIQIEDVK